MTQVNGDGMAQVAEAGMTRAEKRRARKMSKLVELLGLGASVTSACGAVAIGTSTFYRWLATDDGFDELVEEARCDRLAELLRDLQVQARGQYVMEEVTTTDGEVVMRKRWVNGRTSASRLLLKNVESSSDEYADGVPSAGGAGEDVGVGGSGVGAVSHFERKGGFLAGDEEPQMVARFESVSDEILNALDGELEALEVMVEGDEVLEEALGDALDEMAGMALEEKLVRCRALRASGQFGEAEKVEDVSHSEANSAALAARGAVVPGGSQG